MALNEKQLELKLCPIGFELLEEEKPVDASRGGRNTVFHYCEPNDLRASYAGCLHTIEAIMDGNERLRPDCQAAVAAGTCPAIQMRKMELRANRALFFVDYEELMRRRQVKLAHEAEISLIQFRKGNKQGKKFTPTEVEPIKEQTVKAEVVEAPVEIQTNIMEQVLKKKVKDEPKN